MMFEDSMDFIIEAQFERLREQNETKNNQVSRLQEENEELKIKNIALQAIIDTLKAENKKLQNTLDDVLDRQPKLIENAEKYAIKEFAERLKEHFNPDNSYDIKQYINTLVKEMAGK